MIRRSLAASLAYVGTLVPTAIVSFGTVVVLAGPHASLRPPWLGLVILGAAWIVVLIVPVLLSRAAWRRMGGGKGSSGA
jgi:hypothetical protein